ncbi:MAG: TonB-dependent receptor [Janthinobacterium lividum]
MKIKLLTGAALAALVIPGAALAQSTGTVDAENRDVVVTGSRGPASVGGIQNPDTPKARGVLTQEFIAHQAPGQSIDEIINNLPGVSYQNNDPFGNAGGTLTIRGFDASRISQTFDGLPLNDTGNYAIYGNQQLDPELIDQVNVNLGTTDVDSPTASASGSTVNYRSLVPTDAFGVRVVGSAGSYNYFREFGLINTGVFTSFGTKAWVSASHANNNVVFNDFGKLDKQQYNAKLYQPLSSNGDFISVAGNWNKNVNNFFGSVPLRNDTNIYSSTLVNGQPVLVTGAARTPGTASTNRFPFSSDELPYHVARCNIVQGVTGTAQTPNTCGTSYDERYNPSNTGNIRINSRITIAPKLVLSIDAGFEYTKANGGGTVTGRETTGGYTQAATATRGAITTPLYGFIGGNYYVGHDLNGDGDALDQVTLLAPSQTITHRYIFISSLRYDFTDTQSVRVAYTHDYGRHRQTGEAEGLQANGFPLDVFPINNPVLTASGVPLEKRDRLSFALLDQVSGEYRGEFIDHRLTVTAGVRAPFFKRDLSNFCFTTSITGNVDCLGRNAATADANYAAANPYSVTTNATTGATVVTGYAPPQNRVFTYNRVLPSAGFTFKVVDRASIYASYSKGLQVPGTDSLYNAFYLAQSVSNVTTPETTDNYDLGVRYTSSKIQAQAGPWYTRFTNRLASAFDPDTQATIYRNLGRVDKYGFDGDISYRPVPQLLFYVFGSYLKSEIKNNVQLGNCTTTTTANCTAIGQPIYALTAGKRESGAPVYTVGTRIQGDLGPIEIGTQIKRTGERYLNDQNLPELQCTVATVNQVCPTTGISYQVDGATAPAYTTVDFDARLALDFIGLGKQTYLQFNVLNAFNKFYVGGFAGGTTTAYSVPFAQIGSPRAFIGSVNVQF